MLVYQLQHEMVKADLLLLVFCIQSFLLELIYCLIQYYYSDVFFILASDVVFVRTIITIVDTRGTSNVSSCISFSIKCSTKNNNTTWAEAPALVCLPIIVLLFPVVTSSHIFSNENITITSCRISPAQKRQRHFRNLLYVQLSLSYKRYYFLLCLRIMEICCGVVLPSVVASIALHPMAVFLDAVVDCLKVL